MPRKDNHKSRHERIEQWPPLRPGESSTPKKRSKANSAAWYQHLSVVIPLGACVLFAVLLGGAFAVRQIIFLVHGPPDDAALQSGIDDDFESGDDEEPASGLPGQNASSKPRLEVLPPAAAKQPGRKLAKKLLIGPGKNMFSSISEAVKVAVPGDIIEVRTNGPLLEPGAELKRDDRVENAPITIRAGKGFQPVVRSGNPYLLKVLNVDVVFTDLHLTGGSLLFAENCNTTVTNCTFTDTGGISMHNTADGAAFKATFERCFLRTSPFGTLAGPRVSLDARECGVIGIMWPINCMLDEEQSVDVQQCTFLNCYILNVHGSPGKSPPVKPLTFRCNRSVGGLTMCCGYLVNLTVPTEFSPVRTPDDATSALKLAFLNFDGTDSVWGYWDKWGTVTRNDGDEEFEMKGESPFPARPLNDQTLKFGEEFEPVGQLVQQTRDLLGTPGLQRTLLPKHLGVTSTGPLSELRNKGLIVGCDVSKLPVPPPITLEP